MAAGAERAAATLEIPHMHDDGLPEEVADVPDEDDTECGPSEDDLEEFQLRKAA